MNPSCQWPHFGAICGRVAGRISGASFTLDDKTYKLSDNNNGTTIHGGEVGWAKVVIIDNQMI